MAAAGRVLAGGGAGAAWLGSVKVIDLNFSGSQVSLFVGITNAMGCFGGLISQSPFANLVASVGWRAGVLYFSAVPVAVAVALWVFTFDEPLPALQLTVTVAGGASDGSEEYQHLGGSDDDLTAPALALPPADHVGFNKEICFSRQLWLFGAYLAGMDPPFETLAGLFGVQYV
jgi:MFS family permease